MAERVDCVVIGAGVVGLAVARQLAMAGREVIVLEALNAIGTVTSARNSEVIHAGLYYAKDSLKGRLCVQGKALLYDYLRDHAISHQRVQKLIVAEDQSEIAALDMVLKKAQDNGVDDLRHLSGKEATALEPQLRCHAALLSPSTGILDSHGYMLSLRGEAEDRGMMIAFNSPVVGGDVQSRGGHIRLDVGGDAPMALTCTTLVNCAGLDAQRVAQAIAGIAPKAIPPLHYVKGNYFHLSGKAPFEHLIYPVPGTASLGLHYTRDLGGQGRFGPDVEWVDHIDYGVDPRRADTFYDAIRRYWPALEDGHLEPGYSGVRPKLVGPGEPPMDFRIDGAEVHGVAGLVNLFGIESPGLTASLSIARYVVEKLGR